MSFIAKLKLDGEEINVLHCGFRFTQITDATGKPTAIPRGGTIELLVESDGSTDIFDWMISPTQTKNGVITFYRRDTKSKLKTLEFTDGHCVDYYETFDHTGENPMRIQLTVSAREFKLNDSEFKNNWPQ
ncbi:MAG TPA: type VI secretion system tube protein TssD [Puia sp.]|nr:type VI secretion system tube protein TssD [Puia sp.]